MQVAIERSTDVCLAAYLIDDFHQRLVGNSMRGGRSRFQCPGCGSDVVAKGGGPDRLDNGGSIVTKAPAAHFAHKNTSECDFARLSAGESPEHRYLKRFVKGVIESHGWEAKMEVSRPGCRADVLASGPCGLDALIALRGPAREVVFEVQHTPEGPSETSRRTQLHADAGREVVWLFDHNTATQVGRDPAVVVRRSNDAPPVVTRGIWHSPGACPRATELAAFIGAVLGRRITLEAAPTFDAPLRRAWVWDEDLAALARERERVERAVRLSKARAEATARVTMALAELDLRWTIRRRDDPGNAYATIVITPVGTIAVHPRPNRSVALAALTDCVAVIPSIESDKAALSGAGLDPAVLCEPDELSSHLRTILSARAAVSRRVGTAPTTWPPTVAAPAARPRQRRRFLRLTRWLWPRL